MMSALRSCSVFNCVGPVGEVARGDDPTSFLKDECEALWPKCVWRMMQSLRSRTKISEIGFGVLQIGGFIWNLQRENDINREKNGGHYHFPTGRHITKCRTSEGDISKFFMNTWRERANGIHGNLLEVWDSDSFAYMSDMVMVQWESLWINAWICTGSGAWFTSTLRSCVCIVYT
jgi:hypothetical protein